MSEHEALSGTCAGGGVGGVCTVGGLGAAWDVQEDFQRRSDVGQVLQRARC